MPDVKHLILVGLPGVGKSTVGRAVASRLKRGFVDLDAHIERSLGKTVSEIFEMDGELAFRAAEVEMSRQAAAMSASVIAPGGGWILNDDATVHLLDHSRIIYLRVTPEGAVRRMGRGIGRRPLLRAAADPYEAMQALYEARGPRYEGLASITVDTLGMARSNVVASVVAKVLAAERNPAREND